MTAMATAKQNASTCINMSQTLQECQAAGMLASTLGSSNTRPESGKSAAIPAACCSDLLHRVSQLLSLKCERSKLLHSFPQAAQGVSEYFSPGY